MPQRISPEKEARFSAARITGTYLIVLCLWIVASDWVCFRASSDPSTLSRISTIKGCVCVVLSGLFLYNLIRRFLVSQELACRLLAAKEEHYRTMFEMAGVGVALVDCATERFLEVNRKYCEMMGYSQEYLLQSSFRDITHPDDLPLDLDNVVRLKKGEAQALAWEKRFLHGSGRTVQGRVTLTMMPPEGDQPATRLAVVQDITAAKDAEAALVDANERLEERVRERTAELELANRALEAEIAERSQAEAALRSSRERFDLFMEHNPTAAFVMDRQGVFRYISPTYYRMFNVPEGNLEGMESRPFFPADFADTYEANNRRVFESGSPVVSMEPAIRSDGSVGEFLSYKFLIPSPEGDPLLGCFLADVTDLRRAERSVAALNHELQHRIEELQLLLDTAPIGLAITRDYPVAGMIKGNATLERLLGVSADAELSLAATDAPPYRVLRDGVPLAVADLPMQRAARGERVAGESLDIVLGDGHLVHLYACASPLLDEAGTPKGAVGAFLDITEQKQAEEELRLHRDHLDALVKERTAELAARNAQLAVEIEERTAAQNVKTATIALLRLCNEAQTTEQLVRDLVRFFRKCTGFEAVAMRLRENHHFPYVAAEGFPEVFLRTACGAHGYGAPPKGGPDLAIACCLCEMVLSERPRTELASFFTSSGSFWSSSPVSIRSILAPPLGMRCLDAAYRSLALIPFRSQGEIFGLLQLGDRREGAFTAETVALAETLVSYAAIALAKLRSDEALHESARALREAQQIAQLGSYRYDPPCDVWSSSETLDAIFGIDAGFDRSVAGWYSLVHPDDREALAAHVAEAKARQEKYDKEFRIVRASDAEERWVHLVAEVEYAGDGTPLQVVGTVQDVTGRKRGEEALRASERRFRTLIEKAPVAIGIFREATTVYANQKLLEMFGFEGLDELRGHSVGALFAPHCRDEVVQRALLRYLGKPVPSEYEAAAWHQERGEFPVEVAASPVLLVDGVATIAFFYDVSERKKAEAAVRRYTRRLMEVEEDLRKRIASELHDDIGQELTALGLNLCYIGNALGCTVPELSQRLEDSRQIARGISRTVRNLMNELRPPHLDELGLAAALEFHADLFRARTGVSVAVEAGENLPPLSLETETALFRIAQEALTNVAKHAEASAVTVSLASEGEKGRLVVEDDGKGFVAGECAAAADSGWGLTVMRERAALAGASFSVTSSPGEGTRIVIEAGRER